MKFEKTTHRRGFFVLNPTTSLREQPTIPKRRGMCFLIHLRQFLPAHMGVNLRGGYTCVAQHFLDMPKICTVVQHGGGGDMAEQVAGTKAFDPSESDITRNTKKLVETL